MKLTLGGLPQHVQTHGSTDSPLLLILHGGPGFAGMPLFTTYNAELEQDFHVIHWDQRGAGRTYTPDTPPESMTMAQYIADTAELIDWLTSEYGQEKVHLLGHSWGGHLGARVAAQYGDRLHSYICVAPLVASRRNEQVSYDYVVRKATEAGDTGALRILREIEKMRTGEFRYLDLVVQRGLLAKYGGMTHKDLGSLIDGIPAELRTEYFGALLNTAQEFCWEHLLPDLRATDLTRTALSFDIPVHLLLGRHDQTTPSELAAEYFELLNAPHKELYWFEESGHLLPHEEPARFNELVRSIAR
ncbi:alpha/beta hydrolase [Kribbella sandramycini]|uniref:Alpha/beta hydrolase n=1 Tax=Kribbella sandramycini TaxID=60450 RepID=A0A7Y4NZQ0_9ACTN|nr:alpha/beta hydrolase [Kribbella sandramycini]MBB6564613.1 pimeloyl-ACP methyl ester carboxylesterase [Kribbella sandramycini]NOL42317.1 alpha/beta hydrolase [Kribbella sandramycini]